MPLDQSVHRDRAGLCLSSGVVQRHARPAPRSRWPASSTARLTMS
jgi:hypothetical protein